MAGEEVTVVAQDLIASGERVSIHAEELLTVHGRPGDDPRIHYP